MLTWQSVFGCNYSVNSLRIKFPNDDCTLWFMIEYISKLMLYYAVMGTEGVYMHGSGGVRKRSSDLSDTFSSQIRS